MRIMLSTWCFVIMILFAFSTMADNKVVVIPLFGSGSGDKVPTITSKTGRVWMDRNLGATRLAESKNDPLAYGSLYQWGRLTDGHEIRTSPETPLNDLSDDEIPGHGNFIIVDSPPFDWLSSPNNALWGGVSGVNNPCPPGFRVPTALEWKDEISTWFSDDLDGAFGSRLRLTGGGNRDFLDGDVTGEGIIGVYWTSNASGEFSDYVQLHTGLETYIGPTGRAYGFMVRCIKD